MHKLTIGLLALVASLVGVVGPSRPVAAEVCSTGNILQSPPPKYGGIASCRSLEKAAVGTGQETVQVKLKCASGGVATPDIFRFGNVEWVEGSFDTNGRYSVYWCGDTAGDGPNVLQSTLTYVIAHDPAASGCTTSFIDPPASNPAVGSAKCTSLPGHTDVVRVEFRCKTAAGVIDYGLHTGPWVSAVNVNSTTSCNSFYPYMASINFNITST